ncbi:MAG: hypothetical protein K2O00_08700 [Muribaculaceae bacterium]|nr:hypothetical protein [Muribaculaceae bacterium]
MEQLNLTPRTILAYLRKLEEKVPVLHRTAYTVTDTDNRFRNNADLERGAKSILEYVGLDRCVPTCKFDNVPDNNAGCTVNDYSLTGIPIMVDKRYVGNAIACRAILAHEICHKVIYINGINVPPPRGLMENEIYTDLCTMYIGLGRLVLDGYFDKATGQLKMGYLTPVTYAQTFSIVARATGMYRLDENTPRFCDPLLEDALEIWGTEDKLRKVLHDSFSEDEKVLSEVNRNIILLHQILDQVFTKHGDIFRRYSNNAVRLGIFGDRLANKPFTLFAAVYETLFDNSEKYRYSTAQTEISSLILSLTDEYKDIDLGALSYSTVKCPSCGWSSNTSIEDRDAVVRCKSCGVYFRFCNSRLNITRMRKLRDGYLEEKRKAEQAVEVERKRVDDLKKALNDREARMNYEMKGYFQRGKQQGISESNKKYHELVASLPKWVRWLISDYFPEKL